MKKINCKLWVFTTKSINKSSFILLIFALIVAAFAVIGRDFLESLDPAAGEAG